MFVIRLSRRAASLLVCVFLLTACGDGASDGGGDGQDTSEIQGATDGASVKPSTPVAPSTVATRGQRMMSTPHPVSTRLPLLIATFVPLPTPTLPVVESTEAPTVSLEPNAEGFYTAEQIMALARQKVDEYDWPEEYRVSLNSSGIQRDTHAGPDGRTVPIYYEPGYEYTLLELPNQCAWMLAWHDAFQSGDDVAAGMALDELQAVVEGGRTLVASDQERMLNGIEKARLGDSSFLNLFVDGACSEMEWENSDSAADSHQEWGTAVQGVESWHIRSLLTHNQ